MLRVRYGLLVAVTAMATVGAAAVFSAEARHRAAIMRADPEVILTQPDLRHATLVLGRDVFVRRCASCHGAGRGDPARGIPDLTDHDHLYGSGQVAEIEQIVLHGIRSGDPRGWHLAAMPGYAQPLPYPSEPAIKPLSPTDVADVVKYLRRGHATEPVAAARGRAIYDGRGACWDCHGPDGAGNPAIGAPNLNDTIWLYGGTSAALTATLERGRAGNCPAFARVVSPVEARSVAVYVAGLSRGLS